MKESAVETNEPLVHHAAYKEMKAILDDGAVNENDLVLEILDTICSLDEQGLSMIQRHYSTNSTEVDELLGMPEIFHSLCKMDGRTLGVLRHSFARYKAEIESQIG